MALNLVEFVKSVLHVSDMKAHFVSKRQNQILGQALRDFFENPWGALNAGSDVLDRLVRGWGNPFRSANDEYLAAIVDEFSRTDGPTLVCGSGLSTVVLGVLAGITGREVWALENDPLWAQRVEQVMSKLQLTSVRVCVQPLKNFGDFSWYDPPLDSIPQNFSLVICDGPPGNVRGGLSGFLPIMRDYLADRVTILVNNIAREEEKAVAYLWARSLRATVENLGVKQSFAAIRAESSTASEGADKNKSLTGVTVGIPAFNSEAAIGRSIDSVLSQSYANVQLLVSDNCSNDSTQEICLKRTRRDSRLRYFRQKRNIGVFENYNELFRKCKTEYFKWQSSSDYCDRAFLTACVSVLNSNPDVVLVCPKVWLENEFGELSTYDGDFGLGMDDPAARFAYLCDNIQLCNLFNGVMRADVLSGTPLNKSFYGSDIVLLAELALRGKFVLIPDRLWYRRMTPSTASKLHSVEQRAAFFTGAPSSIGKYVTWKKMYALLVAVIRSGSDYRTQLRCLRYLVLKAIWVRGVLFRELFS